MMNRSMHVLLLLTGEAALIIRKIQSVHFKKLKL